MKHESSKSLIVKLGIMLLVCLIPTRLNAQKATSLFEKGKYEKAEQYCSKQKGEDQKSCYKEVAECYFKIENHDKAAECYAKTNNSKDGYYKIANAYFDLDSLEVAAEYYARTDKSKDGYLKVANAYFTKKNLEKAAEYYAKTDQYNDGYLKIANAYFDIQNYIKAEEFYTKTDNFTEGFQKIADIYFTTENYEAASKLFRKIGNEEKAEECLSLIIIKYTAMLIRGQIGEEIVREKMTLAFEQTNMSECVFLKKTVETAFSTFVKILGDGNTSEMQVYSKLIEYLTAVFKSSCS